MYKCILSAVVERKLKTLRIPIELDEKEEKKKE